MAARRVQPANSTIGFTLAKIARPASSGGNLETTLNSIRLSFARGLVPPRRWLPGTSLEASGAMNQKEPRFSDDGCFLPD